jgi:hypothetical protein
MSSSHRSFRSAPPRRPAGPRCHGGASSLLRLGYGTQPQRVAAARASGWSELGDAAQGTVEHVVGWPLRSAHAAAALSS